MGSKNRIAKYIVPIMEAHREEGQWWVEPFVGGGNVIDKVSGKRIGADLNHYVIEALLSIRDHCDELPKSNNDFTESDYRGLRHPSSYEFKAYAGFAFSYGGKWLGGWRRDREGRRDYVREAYDNAVKQSEFLKGVVLKAVDYRALKIPPRSLIYCDPPYAHTTKYQDGFDSKEFWEWCRIKKHEGHTVFVSEYSAPSDFTCLWQKEIVSSLTKDTGSKKAVEKLYKIF